MSRCICCPVLSGCATGCYIPTTIDLTLTVGAVTNPRDFTPTQAEKDLLADVVNGTYVLEYFNALSYQLSLSSGGYDKVLAVDWKCTDTFPVVQLTARFCKDSSPYQTFNVINSAGLVFGTARFDSTEAGNVVDYCGGQTEVVNEGVDLHFLKQAVYCNPTGLGSLAVFDVDVVIEA